jgi:hypothetical protein
MKPNAIGNAPKRSSPQSQPCSFSRDELAPVPFGTYAGFEINSCFGKKSDESDSDGIRLIVVKPIPLTLTRIVLSRIFATSEYRSSPLSTKGEKSYGTAIKANHCGLPWSLSRRKFPHQSGQHK